MTDSAYEEIPAEDEDSDMDDYAPMSKEEYERGPQSERVRELLAMRNARLDAEYAAARPSLIEYYRSGGVPDSQPMRALYDSLSPVADTTEPPPIKGGPGSGFHGHEGRPGQRGGSVDDGIPNKEEDDSGAGGALSFEPRDMQSTLALETDETAAPYRMPPYRMTWADARTSDATLLARGKAEIETMHKNGEINDYDVIRYSLTQFDGSSHAMWEFEELVPQVALTNAVINVTGGDAQGFAHFTKTAWPNLVNEYNALPGIGLTNQITANPTGSTIFDVETLLRRLKPTAQDYADAINNTSMFRHVEAQGSQRWLPSRDLVPYISDPENLLAELGKQLSDRTDGGPIRPSMYAYDGAGQSFREIGFAWANAIDEGTASPAMRAAIEQLSPELSTALKPQAQGGLRPVLAASVGDRKDVLQRFIASGQSFMRGAENFGPLTASDALAVVDYKVQKTIADSGGALNVEGALKQVMYDRDTNNAFVKALSTYTNNDVKRIVSEDFTGRMRNLFPVLGSGDAGTFARTLSLPDMIGRFGVDSAAVVAFAQADAFDRARIGMLDMIAQVPDPENMITALNAGFNSGGLTSAQFNAAYNQIFDDIVDDDISTLREVFDETQLVRMFENAGEEGDANRVREFIESHSSGGYGDSAAADSDAYYSGDNGDDYDGSDYNDEDDPDRAEYDAESDAEERRAARAARAQIEHVSGGTLYDARAKALRSAVASRTIESNGSTFTLHKGIFDVAIPDSMDSMIREGALEAMVGKMGTGDVPSVGEIYVGGSENAAGGSDVRIALYTKADVASDGDSARPYATASIAVRKNVIGQNVLDLGYLEIAPAYQKSGVSQSLFDAVLEYATIANAEQLAVHADITIGKYSWAKYGFGYESEYGAQHASETFPRWAENKGIAEPEGGWPTFTAPYDVANYDIPGVTVNSDNISNNDVRAGEELRIGKAFMLDADGHGDWHGVIEMDTFRAMIEMYKQSRAAKSFFVKGGPGSGYFGHEGRPGERGGSVDDGIPNKEEERGDNALSFAPRDTQSALALETDAPTNETPDGSDSQPKTGNLHLDIRGETNRDNGFTGVGASKDELKALMSRVNMGDFQSVNGTLIIRHGKGDEGEDIQKVYLGLRDGEKPIGKAVIVARELRDGNMETYLDTMTVNPEYQARGVSKGLFDVVAGYAEACSSEKISVIADITIGRYSWAMYGFEYANDAKASEITTRFAQWTEKRGIAAPAGGWPKILSPYGYATLDVPGVLIEGSTVKNKDVRPDEQMRVGKAFMLDDKTNGGHGDWAGTISIDKFKEMNEAYKQKMDKRA